MITADFDRMDLEEGDLLLDLGAGGGRHSFEAMRRGIRSVAVDLDLVDLRGISRYSDELSKSIEFANLPAISTLSADARNLPFDDGVFDGAICAEVLEHLDEESKVLSELCRTLRPGGNLAVTVPSFLPEFVNWGISKEYHSAKGGHIRIYTRMELKELVERAGFTILGFDKVHSIHSPYWWLKCLAGVNTKDNPLVNRFEELLVKDMFTPIPWLRRLERLANPMLGKSQVIFAQKPYEKGRLG